MRDRGSGSPAKPSETTDAVPRAPVAVSEPRRVIHDLTVHDDLMCPACDYVLRGLPATRRCPECGGLIVEAIRVAQHMAEVRRERGRSWRRDMALFRGKAAGDAGRGEWRLAPWLALIGVACILMRVAVGPAAGASRTPGPLPTTPGGVVLGPPDGLCAIGVLTLASVVVSMVGLMTAERLGLAGFTSRRAMAMLVLLLNTFAAGVALLVPQAGPALVPVLSTAPLAWLLWGNAPNPTPVLQMIGVSQAYVFLAWLVVTVV